MNSKVADNLEVETVRHENREMQMKMNLSNQWKSKQPKTRMSMCMSTQLLAHMMTPVLEGQRGTKMNNLKFWTTKKKSFSFIKIMLTFGMEAVLRSSSVLLSFVPEKSS